MVKKMMDIVRLVVTLAVASIAMIALGFVLTPLSEMSSFGPVIMGIILVMGLVVLSTYSKFDNLSWFNALLSFIMIGVLVAVMGMFVPSIGGYLLSLEGALGSFLTLGWVVFYLMIGDSVARMIG